MKTSAVDEHHASCAASLLGIRSCLLVTFVFIVGFNTLVNAQQTSAEKEVWRQEEAYWRYVSSGDSKSFEALWSESFTGWPAKAPHPVDKSQVHVWKISDYQLTPLSVREHGNDIVMTFYCAKVTTDGKPTEMRFTHTWRRENGLWHIVGGMACYAPCDAPQSTTH